MRPNAKLSHFTILTNRSLIITVQDGTVILSCEATDYVVIESLLNKEGIEFAPHYDTTLMHKSAGAQQVAYPQDPDLDITIARLYELFAESDMGLWYPSYIYDLGDGAMLSGIPYSVNDDADRYGMTVTDGESKHPLTPEQWKAYAQALTDGTTPESQALVAAGIVVIRIEDGFAATLPVDDNECAVLANIAKLYP